MKYIRIFENYGKENPTEEEVYSDADEYFLSLNPDLMSPKGYNTYAHYVSSRKSVDFLSAYNIDASKISEKNWDEVYLEFYQFLIKKGYAVKTYSPVLMGDQKKVADLIARVNMAKSVNTGGKYGRAIWIKCSSGKSICFYFTPTEDTNWWPIYLSIHRVGEKLLSLYWTPCENDLKTHVTFWNGDSVIDGNFSIECGYDEYDENGTYNGCSAECDLASDSMGYTATVRIPEGEMDPEDVIYIRRK